MVYNQTTICPLCNDAVDRLLYRFHVESELAVIERIKTGNPLWVVEDGICSRCLDYYHIKIIQQQYMVPEVGPYFQVKSADDFVILPIALRLNAYPKFTGKGVTICFIDSGFYLHPDLVMHRNRIKVVIDIDKKRPRKYFQLPLKQNWHGTMTSVVCAGDGYLSKGLYKGIASDAELVLLKVQNDDGKIPEESIEKALQWVLDNHRKFNIRIVNISLSGDKIVPYTESKIDCLAEQLISNGITVVAAVGNSGSGQIIPPANAPNVISVGGINDENTLNQNIRAYHSNYGQTMDGFYKPEIVAPAVWIAAPILPGTFEHKEADVLYHLLRLNDDLLTSEINDFINFTGLDPTIADSGNPTAIKEAIKNRIQTCKYISANYMHVDGTSFAAPIVSSVVAQLLEAEPSLTPADIRYILFSSARRLKNIEVEKQGFGIVQPRKAILKILNYLNKRKIMSPYVNKEKNTIELYIENICAEEITVSGSFNHWAQDTLLMEPVQKGLWRLEIPMLPMGKYHYKFLIDHKMWVEDIYNPHREPDGFNGFNSVLFIEN